MKLTETEGTILAELLFKMTAGNEKLANEIADVIHDMLAASRSIENKTEESFFTTGTVDICGW